MLSREIRFSSVLSLQELRIVQRVFLNGYCIEEWKFHFGFVIPNSINEWTDVIEAAPQILSLQEVRYK